MVKRLQAAGLLLPTLMSVAALGVLIGLGNWQMQRKIWKDGLVAQMAARVTAPPVSLAEADKLRAGGSDIEYMRVRARGRFQHDKELYYYEPRSSSQGWYVYTPLVTSDRRLLLVNRGWVTSELRDPGKRQEGQVTGVVEVVGLVRKSGEKGFFTPQNDPAKNHWYWRSLTNMVAAVADKTKANAYPFFVEVETASKTPGGWPKAGATLLKLTNKHFEYALTWYGLAITLIGVYLAFAWSRLKIAGSGD